MKDERLAMQRLWWDTPLMWIGFGAALLCVSLGTSIFVAVIENKELHRFQSEAIRLGHAEWRDNGNGTPVFQWK